MPAGKATVTDGGFRLSGRWRYASCCDHCDWALLGGMVAADGGAPEGRIFLVPRQDYQTVDTWQVAGLQATGSWDVILDDVFVPAYRTQSMLDNFLLKGPVRRSTPRASTGCRSARSSCAASRPRRSAPCRACSTRCWTTARPA